MLCFALLFFAECRRSCVTSVQKRTGLSTFPYSDDCSLRCSFDFATLCVGFTVLSSCYFASRPFSRAVDVVSFIALNCDAYTPLLSSTILSGRITLADICDRCDEDRFGEKISSPVFLFSSSHYHTPQDLSSPSSVVTIAGAASVALILLVSLRFSMSLL